MRNIQYTVGVGNRRKDVLITYHIKKSVKKVIDKIRERIKENSNQKQETLIKKLNPVIIGWSNYHQVEEKK